MDTTADIPTVTLAELTQALEQRTLDEFWNVLTDDYFSGEFIPGSRRVALDQVGREIAATALRRDAQIVVYCAGPFCPQSSQAVAKLQAFGYTNVRSFHGGLQAWKESGRDLVRAERVAVSPNAGASEIGAGVQEVRITVKGGYSPARIMLAKGIPARLVFAREESSRCSESLLIPGFGVRRSLPAHAETIVELTPTDDGVFGFSCGMQMLRGELVVA